MRQLSELEKVGQKLKEARKKILQLESQHGEKILKNIPQTHRKFLDKGKK